MWNSLRVERLVKRLYTFEKQTVTSISAEVCDMIGGFIAEPLQPSLVQLAALANSTITCLFVGLSIGADPIGFSRQAVALCRLPVHSRRPPMTIGVADIGGQGAFVGVGSSWRSAACSCRDACRDRAQAGRRASIGQARV